MSFRQKTLQQQLHLKCACCPACSSSTTLNRHARSSPGILWARRCRVSHSSTRYTVTRSITWLWLRRFSISWWVSARPAFSRTASIWTRARVTRAPVLRIMPSAVLYSRTPMAYQCNRWNQVMQLNCIRQSANVCLITADCGVRLMLQPLLQRRNSGKVTFP